MAGLFSDTDIPPWLVPKRAPWEALLEGQQSGAQLASNMLRARQVEMQGVEQAAQVGNIMASTELKKQQLEELNQENSAWLKDDASKVPAWAAKTPDYRQEHYNEKPTPQSQRGMKILEGTNRTDQQYEMGKAARDLKEKMDKARLEEAQNKIANGNEIVKHNNLVTDAWTEADAGTRAAIEKLPNGGKNKFDHWTAEAELLINQERISKKLPTIGTKAAAGDRGTVDIKNLEHIRYLRSIGDNAGADLLENHFKHRDATDKLTGETALKEKDLTKQIQSIQKELDAAKAAASDTPESRDKLIKIEERLVIAQEKRHKLFQKKPAQAQSSNMGNTATGSGSSVIGGKAVRVKSPDGKTGTIPADQLDQAKKEGYTPLE